MKHKYDVLVSIGWNCEVSFRIQDYLNHNIDSYMYSWVRVQNSEGLLHSLYHPEDVLSGIITLLDCGMLRCENCQMDFHGIGDKGSLFLENGSPNTVVVEDTIQELKSRIRHTSDKFQKLLRSEKKSLFIWKLNEANNIDSKTICDINNVFHFFMQTYKSGQFGLLIVAERHKITPELLLLQSDQLFVKTISRAADKENVLLDGDIDGWMKLLVEVDCDVKKIFRSIYVVYLNLRWRSKRAWQKTYLTVESMLVAFYHKVRRIK